MSAPRPNDIRRAHKGPAEQALLVSAVFLLIGSLGALPLLMVGRLEGDDLETWFVAHLAVLVALAFGAAMMLARHDSDDWPFGLGVSGQRLAPLAALVAMITFVVGLATLATSAALRYQPSLQFLQLLSSMDIAWVVAGTYLAVRRLFGAAAAFVGGLTMSGVCVWSLWRYVDTVGFTASGGWLVSGEDLLRLVIPFDVIAAVTTLALVAWAVFSPRRPLYATAQRRPQS